ncbi:H(+)/Cl(-) exchange transporter 3 [Venturia nashicola]|nr:H(+)/Cl(-) exchange transporter 3 [Venturia nashicola]
MKSFFLLAFAATLAAAARQGPGWPAELERRQYLGKGEEEAQPRNGPLRGPRMGGPLWQPLQTDKIQYILDRRVVKLDPDAPLVPDADIWDVDLFDTPKETFDILHGKGKRVMCYFSGGGSESWRADFKEVKKSDMGDDMPKWPGEKYLNLKSPTVWKFMQKRIKMAYDKGCDAIDPDNVDPFNDDFGRGGGFKLTKEDSVDFLTKMAAEAKRYGMSVGLKNAEDILPNVTSVIQFAVNEECSTYELGCKQYEPFLKTGKPVFHYEYIKLLKTRTASRSDKPELQSVYPQWANLSSNDIRKYYCLEKSFGNDELVTPTVGRLFSTAIKSLDLGGWVMYCDGSMGDTPTAQTVDAADGAGRHGGPGGLFGGGASDESGRRGGLGGLFGGSGDRGGEQRDGDQENRAPAPNPRPTQSSGQEPGEDKNSGGIFGGLGNWWPFGSRGGAEKRSKFSHVSQDLGMREDLHKRFLREE